MPIAKLAAFLDMVSKIDRSTLFSHASNFNDVKNNSWFPVGS